MLQSLKLFILFCSSARPYYCEKCGEFFKIKNEYAEHAEKQHGGDLPKDLVGLSPPPTAAAAAAAENQIDSIGDIQVSTVEKDSSDIPSAPTEEIEDTPDRL